jgi:hypothetical protein
MPREKEERKKKNPFLFISEFFQSSFQIDLNSVLSQTKTTHYNKSYATA